MEKAYDIKGLVEELKDGGLDVAEDACNEIYDSIMSWLAKSAQMSENKFDDLILAVIPMIDSLVKGQIDKIDGKKG